VLLLLPLLIYRAIRKATDNPADMIATKVRDPKGPKHLSD
jgi:hypothetical protein